MDGMNDVFQRLTEMGGVLGGVGTAGVLLHKLILKKLIARNVAESSGIEFVNKQYQDIIDQLTAKVKKLEERIEELQMDIEDYADRVMKEREAQIQYKLNAEHFAKVIDELRAVIEEQKKMLAEQEQALDIALKTIEEKNLLLKSR